MNHSTAFERRLSGLFDRQRFFHNPALDSLITETESRCFGSRALADDELALVSAAGESEQGLAIPDPDLGRSDP